MNITKNPNRFCEKLYARSKLECSSNWFKRRQRRRENNLTFEFVRNGGKHLFLDEVHKYPNLAQELKNI